MYKLADAQLNGSRCMALGHSFGLLLHGSILDAWLQVMRLEPVSMLAVVQGYGSRCMALGYAFGVFVYAGCCTVVYCSRCLTSGLAFGVCVYAGC